MHKSKIKNLQFNAAILYSLNSRLELKKIEPKSCLKENQFLIKLKYTGICGSQLGEISGVKGKDKYLPHLLGHEGTGIVVAKKSKSRKINIGDKVVLHWKPSNGKDSQNPQYIYKNKDINAGKVTTFNEYAIVPENRITKLKKKTNMSHACLLGCSLTTAYGVLKNNAKVKKNKNILIWGSGAVGQALIILSKLFFVNKIIAIDINSDKLIKSKKLGADILLNYNDKNFQNKISSLTEDIDYIIETTGNTKIIEKCYNILSKKGKLILVGVPHYKKKISIHTLPLHFGKVITGSHGGNIKPQKDIPYLEKLINSNKIKVSDLITNVFEFNKINTALNQMKKNRIIGKAILKF